MLGVVTVNGTNTPLTCRTEQELDNLPRHSRCRSPPTVDGTLLLTPVQARWVERLGEPRFDKQLRGDIFIDDSAILRPAVYDSRFLGVAAAAAA